MTSLFDSDPLFTSLCSQKTLQSHNDGFFNLFYQSVCENFEGENWLADVYKKMPDDQAKLRALYDDPTVCGAVLGTLEHVQQVYRKKDSKFSWQKREQALQLLAENKLNHALVFACQAVMRAPMQGVDKLIDNGLTLALALWNRSEVLIRMLDGEHALKDLQMCVKVGFQAKQNAQYYARMAKCYTLMGEKSKATVSGKLFYQLMGNDQLKLDKLLLELDELTSQKAAATQPLAAAQLPTLQANDDLPGASPAISLVDSTDKRMGKYVVANKPIDAGETVLAEKAVAACLYPRCYGSHCINCCTRVVAPIACPDCCGVAFCSEQCRDVACNSYHKFECKYQDLLIGSGMSILCHIALRIITQSGDAKTALANAESLLNGLCSHSDIRDTEDYFQRSLMAAFLLRCLQKAEFFGRRMTEAADPYPHELEIGVLILRLLQALQFNAHEIYETRLGQPHRISDSKVMYIGVGIYKTGALFNHECYPSVTRYFCGTSIVFNTIRPVETGGIVAENYGPIFTRQTLEERQRNLMSRYWFKCECRTCTENWPMLKTMDHKARFKCPTEGCQNVFNYPKDVMKPQKCRKCNKTVPLGNSIEVLRRVEDIYDSAARCLEDNNLDEAVKSFKEGINLFHKICVPPHKSTHIAEESLRTCFADAGNIYRAC